MVPFLLSKQHLSSDEDSVVIAVGSKLLILTLLL